MAALPFLSFNVNTLAYSIVPIVLAVLIPALLKNRILGQPDQKSSGRSIVTVIYYIITVPILYAVFYFITRKYFAGFIMSFFGG